MGNYTSICFIQDSDGKKRAKVIDGQGKLKKVKLPMKAAELMLEEPGHIISPAEDLKRTRRVTAMRADDELLAAKVYVLVPVGRVRCKVLEADLAVIGGKKMRKSAAKVYPKEEEDSQVINKVLGLGAICVKGRLGNYRPWTPASEPISEVL